MIIRSPIAREETSVYSLPRLSKESNPEMARPLRLEFGGALYHVTARGNERRSIFLGEEDGDGAAFFLAKRTGTA